MEWNARVILDFSFTISSLPPYRSHSSVIVSWQPPPFGYFKLNFDGSDSGSSAVVGVAIRDSSGKLVGAQVYRFGQTSTLFAEVWGLRNGLLLAIQQQIQDLYIEGDNQVLIRILQGHYACPWTIQTLIEYIQHLLRHFKFYTIKHIFREANRVADLLLKKGHNSSATSVDIDPSTDPNLQSLYYLIR